MIWKAQLKHELHRIFCASNHCPFIFVMDKWIEKFDESCLKSFRLFLQGHFDIFYWADSMICMLIFQKGDSTNDQTCPNLSRSPETHWVVVLNMTHFMMNCYELFLSLYCTLWPHFENRPEKKTPKFLLSCHRPVSRKLKQSNSILRKLIFDTTKCPKFWKLIFVSKSEKPGYTNSSRITITVLLPRQ